MTDVEFLRSIEWNGQCQGAACCPSCWRELDGEAAWGPFNPGYPPQTHTPDCELQARLQAAVNAEHIPLLPLR